MSIKNNRRRYFTGLSFLAVCGAMIYSCQSSQELEYAKYMSNGKDLYRARCQNCHGEKGEGLGELAPPLTDTVFLKTYKDRIACIIKEGSHEEMRIHNKIYHERMPSFPDLAPIDIAQLTVYITNSFGNRQGMYTYEQVMSDLTKCKSLPDRRP